MRFSPKQNRILIAISFILLILILNFFQKEVKNFFYLISSPIQKWFWQGGGKIASFLKVFSEIKNLKEENEKLLFKNQELLVENFALKEIKKENEFLKKALEINLEEEFKVDLVQVLGKDVFQDFLIINKGFKDGISIGLPVITEEKVLVGKINKVYENFSKVTLLTAKDFSFDGEIAEKEIYGILKGKGGLKLSLEFLPIDKEVKEGDVVVTAILGGVFPRGLLVGKIKRVQKSDIESFQRAEVEPALRIEFSKNLLVIKKW